MAEHLDERQLIRQWMGGIPPGPPPGAMTTDQVASVLSGPAPEPPVMEPQGETVVELKMSSGIGEVRVAAGHVRFPFVGSRQR